MKNKTFFIFVFSLICLIISSGYGQQTADKMYQAGLYEEDVKGDLKGALAIYEKIVSDVNADRTVKAKAQLHIGLCYEKLGQNAMEQAQNAFRKVVDKYPHQIEQVTKAQ